MVEPWVEHNQDKFQCFSAKKKNKGTSMAFVARNHDGEVLDIATSCAKMIYTMKVA